MPIPRISVVLNGDDNDKLALQTAVRLAAREHAQVRVYLGTTCSVQAYEKHLDFALWDVQERLKLPAPELTVVFPVDAVALAGMQEEPAWICG